MRMCDTTPCRRKRVTEDDEAFTRVTRLNLICVHRVTYMCGTTPYQRKKMAEDDKASTCVTRLNLICVHRVTYACETTRYQRKRAVAVAEDDEAFSAARRWRTCASKYLCVCECVSV